MRRSVLVLAAVLWAGCAFGFELQGHRGARGLAPENTLAAFERALALGVDTLELDVALTADGVLVVSHDPYLNPVLARDGSGQWLEGKRGPLIRNLTLAQLRTYDVGRIRPGTPYAATFARQQPHDGARVPTLQEVFALAQERRAPVRFNIETKLSPDAPLDTASPQELVQALLAAVRATGLLGRVTIQSFDWRTLQLVQQLEPGVPTGYLTIQTTGTDNVRNPAWTAGLKLEEHGSVPRLVKAAGDAVWSPNGGAVTQALVQEAQALGLQVVPWTINDPAAMERLLGWGVDGIITDHPERLREVLARRGLPLPAPAP